ncbi:hypothetical protein R6Q59_017769 [Mikania micrantha]
MSRPNQPMKADKYYMVMVKSTVLLNITVKEMMGKELLVGITKKPYLYGKI